VGYARLLEKSSSSAEGRAAATSILDECQTLETVVRRFVDFVKDEGLNLAPFDLGGLLRRVVARETRGRSGGGVDLRLSDAPAVVGDEELLERAFENVVRNAVEAAGPGGTVTVSAGATDDGRAWVAVTDDGPGLPPERRTPRLFYTSKPGGLGLGLAMAQKVIGLHQGLLSFEDVVPRGLTVRIHLPVAGPVE
jgi:signal transduction histidine kinase